MDRIIGEVVQELKKRKLFENTLIVFISDNGKPFTRAKGTLYDEGIRTPLIFHWPEAIRPERVSEEMVSVINLAPTFLDLASIPKPAEMPGNSMVNLIKGNTYQGDQYVFSERNWHDCDEHMRSIRSDTFKLIKMLIWNGLTVLLRIWRGALLTRIFLS